MSNDQTFEIPRVVAKWLDKNGCKMSWQSPENWLINEKLTFISDHSPPSDKLYRPQGLVTMVTRRGDIYLKLSNLHAQVSYRDCDIITALYNAQCFTFSSTENKRVALEAESWIRVHSASRILFVRVRLRQQSNSYSLGINFRRHNLTSVDVRFWRLKLITAL